MLKTYVVTLFCLLLVIEGVLTSKIYFPGTYSHLKKADPEIKKIDSRTKSDETETSNGEVSSSKIYFPGTYSSSKSSGHNIKKIDTRMRGIESSTTKLTTVTIENRFLFDVKCRSNFIKIGDTCIETSDIVD
ncbi:uncharacterized protein LOC143191686 [Rhynchophorus ferrugineus]|uniref:uncharacterized protein LOC143191686 n=1 Tax=Rhynchophorus ferrugineus TaxID=354439 RepID=UPI003FCC719D